MVKKLSFIFYKLLFFIDKFFKILTKRSFLIWFKDFIDNDFYKKKKILDKDIYFFAPNQLITWRVDTLFSTEPETIEWINNFKKKDDLIFWDIGANIGLYSIYNSIKNKSSSTIAFEPSTSNLRVLSRNISINKLENLIKIFPIPLTNKENKFLLMKEGEFMEGAALNTYGETFDFEGKKLKEKMNYKVIGTKINYLIDNKILEIPDYIKIDVDGIEHLILEGANNHLKNKKIKSLLIEINENFTDQFQNVLKIMEENQFKILKKRQNKNLLFKGSKFSNTFNYIFER